MIYKNYSSTLQPQHKNHPYNKKTMTWLDLVFVTDQLNTTRVGFDKVMGWPTPPTHPLKLLRHFQATQKDGFGMQPYFDPNRWNIEDDLNIFENWRRPQFFPNRRRPRFCSRQPRELIFGMLHSFNQTRWNMDLNFLENGRRPQLFENGRRPQFYLMEEGHNFFLKIEDNLIL